MKTISEFVWNSTAKSWKEMRHNLCFLLGILVALVTSMVVDKLSRSVCCDVICSGVKHLKLSAKGGPRVYPFTSRHNMKTLGFSNWWQNSSVPSQCQLLLTWSLEEHLVVQYSWNINPKAFASVSIDTMPAVNISKVVIEKLHGIWPYKSGTQVPVLKHTSLYPQKRHLGLRPQH